MCCFEVTKACCKVRMNIYTLHQEGSFRPPSRDCDSEIENSQSVRNKIAKAKLQAVTEEKNPHCSTSFTSNSSGSGSVSSLGEKTTPRHNTRVNGVTSRIDASGVITDTNNTELLISKEVSNPEPKANPPKPKKTMNSGYPPPPQQKKGKRSGGGLIHIQARDEFMIFEDDTDLVSYITTPSAVRTSPLESDYLVIDHEEFADEEDLISLITVPKALRKKKSKSKRKPKAKNGSSKPFNGKEDQNIKKQETSISNQEQREPVPAAPSTSNDESEGNLDVPEELSPTSPRIIRRSLTPLAGDNSDTSKKSDSRGGKRATKPIDEAQEAFTPPIEEIDPASHDQGEDDSKILSPADQDEEVRDEKKFDSQREEKKKLLKEETSNSQPSTLQTKSVSHATLTRDLREESASKTSTSVTKSASGDSSEKSGVQQGQKQDDDGPDDMSPKPAGIKISTTRTKKKNSHVDKDTRDDLVAKPSSYGLDITAQTILDSTTGTSNEETIEMRKSPNSRRRTKMWWLPTSHFCNQKKKKREQQKMTCQSESFPRSTSVPDYKAGNLKQERRISK